MPISILKVTQRLGGTLLGAFGDQGRLDGFVFGLSGLVDGQPVHWSDMLAVRAGRRDVGLGLALKLRQREELLAAGIATCLWTFDPLESRNAHLNLERLGVVVREYARDLYGESDSPLHQGIGTDRFVALWLLDAPRVRDRVAGRRLPVSDPTGLPVAFDVGEAGGLPVPSRSREGEPPDRFLVPIPRHLQELKARDAGLARAWRLATRAALEGPLAAGFQVAGFLSGRPVGHYLVERLTADPEEVA